MVPDCLLDNVVAAGNSAGAGARMALLNIEKRAEIESVVRDIEKIETAAGKPLFQDHFVRAMAMPHKTDPYEELTKAVTLPFRSLKDNAGEAAAPSRSGRRRRRA